MKTSPLATLDLSSEMQLADRAIETRRELINAYARIEDLQGAMRELLWLIEYVGRRDDILPDVCKALTADHRVIDAQELLA
jgi:hypothetical protein